MNLNSTAMPKTGCNPNSMYSANAELLAAQLKALAHPVRLQILHHLGDWREGCCNDFCACIPLAQSTISQHLKILSKAGIIEYKPVGNCSKYKLNSDVLDKIAHAMADVRQLAKTQEK